MYARRELTVEQKKVVINLTKQKFSQKNVAGVLNVSQSCRYIKISEAMEMS